MIATCSKCGVKSHADEEFCSNCGATISGLSKMNMKIPSDTVSTEETQSRDTDTLEYKEQTMTLRMATVVLWFGIFMSLITMAIFFVAFLPSILVTLPVVLFEVWIAMRLGKFNRWARYGLILISMVTISLGLYTWIVNDSVNIFIFLMAVYTFYAMVFHRPTVELFSGKYRPDPSYDIFPNLWSND